MTIRKIAALSAIALMLSPLAASAQTFPAPPSRRVTPEQASGSQGQSVTVEGIASLGDANGMPPGMFLRLNSNGGPGAPFAGYIAAEEQNKFPGLGDLQGRVVAITGVVEKTTTIPIIRLHSSDQIAVIH